ncbi:hypothetical protein D9M71_239610 [compost metagenome]
MLLVWAVPADASTSLQALDICIWHAEVPPYTSPMAEAQGQQLVRRVMNSYGLTVTFVARPWNRCIKETAEGRFQAVMPVAPTSDYQQLIFPRRQGEVDSRQALGVSRLLAMRPRGSQANWDGKRFSGVRGPVIHLHGISAPKVLLERHGMPAASVARPEDMGEMLLRGRSNLAIDLDYRLLAVMRRSKCAGRLELLSNPLLETHMYLAFSKHFYQANGALVEQVWQSFGEWRLVVPPNRSGYQVTCPRDVAGQPLARIPAHAERGSDQ